MRKTIVGLLVLALVGALGFWGLTSPAAYALIRGNDPVSPTPPAGSMRQPNLENGRTLFFAGGCTSCHAVPSQTDKLRLGGGYALKSPFGTFHIPNISPHKQDGIGSWSTADFVRAMREGVLPDGRHYYP
ncbi:MAG: alkylated DNA repair protein, partial [Microvirga sp.]